MSDPDVWRAGYYTTAWHPLVAECRTVTAAAGVPMLPMLVPLEEELPVPQPTEFESPPNGADSAPSVPEPPGGGHAPGSAATNPFVVPSVPTAYDDPFESDDHFRPRAEPTTGAPTACTPIAWMPLERDSLEFKDVVDAGWDQPLGDTEFPPLTAEQAQTGQ